MTEKNDVLLDDDLRAVMGDRIKDDVPVILKKNPIPKPAPVCTKKPAEAKWEPVKEPYWKDKLKEAAKYILIFGGICLWLFYLQQSELMDSDTAYRAMIVCNLLAGFNVGKRMAREADHEGI